jgi:D-beta-D-heptose 7-phosphate kinase/D-beta-D-heptose 1-phosphate adenosyltransferase
MREKLCSTVQKWGSPAILVVGDFMLDTYVYGDASRISPEAPVPVLSVCRTEYRCGGAGSVAADIAALGGRAVCLGVTGRDRNGKILKSLLTKAGVQTKSLFAVPDRPTVSKQRLIGLAQHRHYQQLIRIDHESCRPLPPDQVDMVIRSYKENLNQADIVCLQDYDKGMLSRPVCSEIIQCARQADKGVIVDPALGTDYAKYNGALMVAPNRKEASVAVGFEIKTPHHAARSAKKLMRMFALGAVVITLDKDGAYLKTRDAEKFIPTKTRNVYDVTGAGDIVLAALAMTLARGRDFEAAVQLANIAGGIEVEKFGTAAVTVDEILAELHAQKSRQSGKVTAAHCPRPTGFAPVNRENKAGRIRR